MNEEALVVEVLVLKKTNEGWFVVAQEQVMRENVDDILEAVKEYAL